MKIITRPESDITRLSEAARHISPSWLVGLYHKVFVVLGLSDVLQWNLVTSRHACAGHFFLVGPFIVFAELFALRHEFCKVVKSPSEIAVVKNIDVCTLPSQHVVLIWKNSESWGHVLLGKYWNILISFRKPFVRLCHLMGFTPHIKCFSLHCL